MPLVRNLTIVPRYAGTVLMGELLLEEVPKAARSAGGDLSDLVAAITTAILVASSMRSTLAALTWRSQSRRAWCVLLTTYPPNGLLCSATCTAWSSLI